MWQNLVAKACGESLWKKLVAKPCSKDLVARKLVAKSYGGASGENLVAELVAKTLWRGKNLVVKILWRS